MQNPPLISVVVACFNARDTLDEAIRSVLAQTHAAVEVVVVDDRSTDDTWEWLTTIDDDRVSVEQMPENGGPGPARNRALSLATGEWLTFMDADDRLHPQRLERLLELAQQNPGQMVLDRQRTWRGEAPEPDLLTAPPQIADRFSLGRWLREDRGGKIFFSRALWESSGATQPAERAGEDTAFIVRLGWKTNAELVMSGDRTYLYRVGRASLTSSPEQPVRVLRVIRLLRDELVSRPDLLSALDHLEARYQERLFMKQLRGWLTTGQLRRATKELVTHPRLLARVPRVALKAVRVRLKRR